MIMKTNIGVGKNKYSFSHRNLIFDHYFISEIDHRLISNKAIIPHFKTGKAPPIAVEKFNIKNIRIFANLCSQ